MTMTSLETLRRDRELTLQQLADLAGVSHSLVHKVEKGYRPARNTTREKIASALGTTVAELFPNLPRR